MKPSVSTSELLSSLADDQLDDFNFAAALEACRHDKSALARWEIYHLIGDALRSHTHAGSPLKLDAQLAFVGRVSERLAQEPRIQAESASAEAKPVAFDPPVMDLRHARQAASNDGSFRWKLLAGVASLAAVSAIAWTASGQLLAPASAPQLAQASSSQIVVASPQGMMVRDARLEELLAAHKQLGAASALQESSGFLQNASFGTPQLVSEVNGR